jgi:hypothetical protein
LTQEHDIGEPATGLALPPPVRRGVPSSARRILLIGIGLAVAATVGAAALRGSDGAIAVAVGSALGLGNFWLIGRMVVKTTTGDELQAGRLLGQLLVKLFLFGGVVASALFVARVDAVGLLLGLSLVFAAIAVNFVAEMVA